MRNIPLLLRPSRAHRALGASVSEVVGRACAVLSRDTEHVNDNEVAVSDGGLTVGIDVDGNQGNLVITVGIRWTVVWTVYIANNIRKSLAKGGAVRTNDHEPTWCDELAAEVNR
jgi:hypothetical protein